MTDQHADRILGCVGDSVAETPVTDLLAEEGTMFSACDCPSQLCVPPCMAILTGLETHETGELADDGHPPSDAPAIAHAVTAAGYDCRAIGRVHLLGSDQHHGFDSRPLRDVGSGWPGGAPPDIALPTKGRASRGPSLEHSGAGITSNQVCDLSVADVAEDELDQLIAQRSETGIPSIAIVSLSNATPHFFARRKDFDRFTGRVPPPARLRFESERPRPVAWHGSGRVGDLSDSAIKNSRAAQRTPVAKIDEFADRKPAKVTGRRKHRSDLHFRPLRSPRRTWAWWQGVMFAASARVPLIVMAPSLPVGRLDTRVTNLTDLSRTHLDWADKDLRGYGGTDLGKTESWPDQQFASCHGSLMKFTLSPALHRMLRSGTTRPVWFAEGTALSFELENHLGNCVDFATESWYSDILSSLKSALFELWDPDAIESEMHLKAVRRRVGRAIRDWVPSARPSEPMPGFDPDPGRNRYE